MLIAMNFPLPQSFHTLTLEDDTQRVAITARAFPGEWSVEVTRRIPPTEDDNDLTVWFTKEHHVVETLGDAMELAETLMNAGAPR